MWRWFGIDGLGLGSAGQNATLGRAYILLEDVGVFGGLPTEKARQICILL